MEVTSLYRIPQPRGYANSTFYVEDTSDTSPNYFDVTYYPTTVGGGRYLIIFRGNQTYLRTETQVDIEIIDAAGKNIYTEVLDYRDRFNNYYINFDIYNITAAGFATIHLVGEATRDLGGRPVPQNQQGRYNVRWRKTIEVLPYDRNNADLFFSKPPQVSVAQILAPVRVKVQTAINVPPFKIVTSSIDQLSIQQSNFEGYDRDAGSSAEILDPRIRAISVNVENIPQTTNTVNTTLRESDSDIVNGYKINLTTRFGTILTATSSFFSKSFLGGLFEFHNSSSTPQSLQPAPASNFPVSGSIPDQLQKYKATVVEVINNKQCVLDTPVSVQLTDLEQEHVYKQISLFTGSIAYIPSDTAYATSTTITQSYLEFTFQDITPTAGDIYRIKSYAKLSTITSEYKQLNDQVLQPVEYLTDARYPNPTNYSRYESEYRIIGQFTTPDILTDNWIGLTEYPTGFGAAVQPTFNNSILIESAKINAAYTESGVFTTKFPQNYTTDQPYTLAFYLTLDPYTELEIYGSSDPLNQYVLTSQVQPRAFLNTTNTERTRYTSDLNRFGKYIGKIVNDRPNRKYYGRVVFDYETDGNGFGKPLMRARTVDETPNTTGSAYVSDISIKPYTLNGFTPKLIQYAVPVPEELTKALTLSQSIDFRFDYFDYTGRQSENATYLDSVIVNFKGEIPTNTCQAQTLNFEYNSAANSLVLQAGGGIPVISNPSTNTTYATLAVVKEVTILSGPNTIAVFSPAIFATPPPGSGLPAPTVGDFRFYINGQLISPKNAAVTFIEDTVAQTCELEIDASILKYTLGANDVVTAIGPFDPTV